MDEKTTSRRRGRQARIAARRAVKPRKAPFITRSISPAEVLDAEGLVLIETNAETILEEIGIEFRGDPEALELWRRAGADVAGERVRMPRGLARSLIASAPAEFTQHARNPERSVGIGGDGMVFAPAYGAPFVHDLDGGRRYGTIEDFRNLVRLAYMTESLHHSGGTLCEPVDLAVGTRHLEMVYSHIRYSDKPFMGSVTHPQHAADSVAMAEIVFGADFVADNTVLIGLINANSPMVYDASMLGALKVYARAGQAVIVTPFIISGAMGPVSAAGTLAQALAEGMAGAAFVQLVRPGTPVVFGLFSSSMSMQSGSPTFGTPEPQLVLLAAAQLVRRLGVPFRAGGALCSSKIPDAQAAYESANSMVTTVLGGVNFVLHGAGWLEGALCVGYEKFVLDADQLAMMEVLAGGIRLDGDAQAMAAIREVGPGGHFLGCAHTLAHFETAFHRSPLADVDTFEQWQAQGSLDAAQRANRRWKRLLDEYREPGLDEAVDEELQAFIAARKAEPLAAAT